MISRSIFGLLCISALVSGLAIYPAIAAPQAELWERWTANDPNATKSIDHSAWERFLESYVSRSPDRINRVDYAEVSAADDKALDAYVSKLEAVPISKYARPEQLAYWINLYNALTLKVVLDHYPVASIRDIDISPGFFASGPWDKKLIEVEAEALSLNDIEHRILRPIWRDPRIHYAVNCASIGCPNLQQTVFTAANADALLNKAAREYVNHPRGYQVTHGELIVSSIYVWYQEDFGGSDEGVIAHARQYAKPQLAAALSKIDEIEDDYYDWSLNAQH